MTDLADNPEQATGFVFEHPDSEALLACIQRALLFYREYPQRFKETQMRAMHSRFTWQQAAEQYLALYNAALGG